MSKINYAFGIFQDGLNIKIAQLVEQDGDIRVQKLDQTTLSYPLYVKSDEEMIEMYRAQADDTWDSSFEDVMDNISKIQEEEAATSKAELQNLLSEFPLEKGKISLNIDDEQITYYKFDAKVSPAKMYKTLKKNYIPNDELNAKDYQMGFIGKDEEANLAIVQHGENYLLNSIKEIRKQIGKKKKFAFGHVNTNEISLMNLLEFNYDFNEDEYVLLIYVGLDYKVGIVMKGNQHFKTFPIIVNSSDPEEVRQAIFSKIMLQQDICSVPISQHIILAGEEIFVNDETCSFFQQKIHREESLECLKLHNIKVDVDYESNLSDAEISKYAIPIALAWKTLIPQEKKFRHSNLLPNSILEEQKFHKITWHGYLTLAAIFGFVLMATLNHMELSQDIDKTRALEKESAKELSRVQAQYETLLKKVEVLRKVEKKPTDFELSLQSINRLQQDKKEWHSVLKTLQQMVAKYPISWITGLNRVETGFVITAFTTKKRNIIRFADIFPDGFIQRINRTSVQGVEVWQFDIRYSFPKKQAKPKEIVEEGFEPDLSKKAIPESNYQIQILAAKDKNKVVRLARKLENDNIPVNITNFSKNNKIWYRLRLANSYNLTQAKHIGEDLKKNYQEITSYWLDKQKREYPQDALGEYNQAVDLYFTGDYSAALLEFENYLSEYSHSYLVANAEYLRGECLYKLGKIEEARKIFKDTVEKNRAKKPDALKILGKIALANGKKQQAIKLWQQVVQNYPNHYIADDVKELLAGLER